MSRKTIASSAAAGCPARPSEEELIPSCICWPDEREASSQCSAITASSNASAYVRALRSVRAVGTHRPSSLKTRTPAATISPISARTSPSSPFVIAPTGNTSARPARAAAARTSAIDGCVVGDGIGVRHRRDGRVPAGGGRPRPGLDRLLLLEPGFAQVRVQIDQPGREDQPVAVEDLGRRGVEAASDVGHHPVPDVHVGDLVEPGAWIHHASSTEQQLGASHRTPLRPPRPADRPAAGTAAPSGPRCRS